MTSNQFGIGSNTTSLGVNNSMALSNRVGTTPNGVGTLFPTSRSNGFNRVLQNNPNVNQTGTPVGGGMTQPLPAGNQ